MIALALALPAALKLFVTNAQAATGNFASAVDVSVYLKTDVPLAKAQQLAQAAQQRAGRRRGHPHPAPTRDSRTSAPTPASVMRSRRSRRTRCRTCCTYARAPRRAPPPALESLRRYFAAWPEVDLVQVDSEWVMRFNAILEVLRRLLLIAAALLGVGVLAVIGNTIRLEIQARRAEIEVTKLVGGSNAFVRRPFLYTGVLYGLGGALLAWGILAAGRAGAARLGRDAGPPLRQPLPARGAHAR